MKVFYRDYENVINNIIKEEYWENKWVNMFGYKKVCVFFISSLDLGYLV